MVASSAVYPQEAPSVQARKKDILEMPSRMSERLIIPFMMVLLGWGAVSCSSNRAFPPQGRLYEKDQLEAFLGDTDGDRAMPGEYRIGVGDKLDVVFPIDEKLSTRDLIVRYDGRISLPYLGDVMAAGYTPMELDSILTRGFGEILRTPELSVIVRSSAKKLIYVVGQVNKPGGFPHEDQVSLVQAITLAGGFASGAKSKNVVLIRRMGRNRIVGVEVNVEAILKGRALNQDFILKDYDIVYVPKTRIKSAAEFSEQFMKILDPPFGLAIRAWQFVNLQAAFEFYRTTTR